MKAQRYCALLMTVSTLLGCADEPIGPKDNTQDSGDPPGESWLPPDQSGPWVAATWATEIDGPDGVRLPVQVWYPTSTETVGTPHRYEGLVEGTALDDVLPLCAGVRPVALFSHGHGGVRFQSIFLMEHLAARGWIVLAPDHVGGTTFDEDPSRLQELVFRRPLDIRAAADWLYEEAGDTGGFLDGCVDENLGYAAIGHSFGGYTSLALMGGLLDAEAVATSCSQPDRDRWLCAEVLDWFATHPENPTWDLRDLRVWGAVPMAPAGRDVLEPSLLTAVAPVLVLGGARDDTTTLEAQVGPLYEAVGSRPKSFGLFQDAGHYTFSNACDWVPTYPDCSEPYLDPKLAFDVINTAVAGFLDVQRGEDRATEYFPPSSQYATFTVEP